MSTKNDSRQAKTQVNSLDFVVSVDRLAVSESRMLGIYLYGNDNNYPRKIIETSKRSSSLTKAKNIQAKFVQGLGFDGARTEDAKKGSSIVINSKGQTLYNLLQFYAQQKANINVAIHVNYNALGEAVEFNMIQYEFVRKKVKLKGEKFERYIITNIWHLENDLSDYGYSSTVQEFNSWMRDKETQTSFTALECFEYDPDPATVREQIELSGGIENYSGQLFYKKRTEDIYQEAIFDSVIDDAQFEAETKLQSLSNVQNSYSVGGILKHFGNLDGTKELDDLKKKTANKTGAHNTGRVVTVSIPANQNMPSNLFEPTQMLNIDSLAENQMTRAQSAIQELYQQPNAIGGKDTEGNFATQKMQETFDFYNSITEPLRQEVEIELTELISNSVFSSQVKLPIEIEPIMFVSRTAENQSENDEIKAESQARLKGTVGGVQGVLQIQQSVSQGLTQYDAGIEILKDIYGYDEEQAKKMLGEPVKQFVETEKVNEKEKPTKTVKDEATN